MKAKSIFFYPLLPFRVIWFIWILIWFFITGIIAFPINIVVFNIFKGKRKVLITFFVTKWWGKILMAGMGIFVRAKGTEKLDKSRPMYWCRITFQWSIFQSAWAPVRYHSHF